jgi:hypothetical protein
LRAQRRDGTAADTRRGGVNPVWAGAGAAVSMAPDKAKTAPRTLKAPPLRRAGGANTTWGGGPR